MMNDYFTMTEFMPVNKNSKLVSPLSVSLLSSVPAMHTDVYDTSITIKNENRIGMSDDIHLPNGARHDLFTTRTYHGTKDFTYLADRERDRFRPIMSADFKKVIGVSGILLPRRDI